MYHKVCEYTYFSGKKGILLKHQYFLSEQMKTKFWKMQKYIASNKSFAGVVLNSCILKVCMVKARFKQEANLVTVIEETSIWHLEIIAIYSCTRLRERSMRMKRLRLLNAGCSLAHL